MTIANNYVLTKQATNGSTTVFSFSFYALNADYIKVVKETDDVQTVVDPSDYTVSFDENGGTVTFGTAPAAGSYIIVYRETPKEQETPFATSSGFPAKTMEGKLDKLTAMVQEDSEALDRSIKYPKGSNGSMLLPVPDAGRAIVWNETEDGLANSTLDLEYLAESVPNINKCAENEQNINAAVANEANINAAVANQSNINAVANNINNVNAVASNETNINAVVSNETNINAAVANATDISTVATNISDVGTVATSISDVNDCADNMQAITDAPNYAQEAKDWANKTDGTVDGSEYSAKHYAEQASSTVNDKVNRTAITNYFATNGIKAIGCNINLVKESSKLKLKAGSKYYLSNGTSVSVDSDIVWDLSSVTTEEVFPFVNAGNPDYIEFNKWLCGTNRTGLTSGVRYINYNTNDKKIYSTTDGGTTWTEIAASMPLGLVYKSNGIVIKYVFNGAGYMGDPAKIFTLPDITYLLPNGRNQDGTLKSIELTTNAIALINWTEVNKAYVNLENYAISTTKRWEWIKSAKATGSMYYNASYYVEDENNAYVTRNHTPVLTQGIPFVIAEWNFSTQSMTTFEILPVSVLGSQYIKDTLGYNPENVSNKVTSVSSSSTDTQYPTAKAVYDIKDGLESSKQDVISDLETIRSGAAAGATAVQPATLDNYATNTALQQGLSEKIDKGYAVNDFATNCITEIPQDIKLELSSGTLTIKDGSVITLADGTQKTISGDKTYTHSTNGTYFAVTTATGGSLRLSEVSNTCSGSTDALAGVANHTWYDTTNKVITVYGSDGTSAAGTRALPVGIVTVSGGAISSIDKVFNGIGFIGTAFFALPGMSYLFADGLNTDGTLKSGYKKLTSLVIRDFSVGNNTYTTWLDNIGRIANNYANTVYYNAETNHVVSSNVAQRGCIVVNWTQSGGVITDFNVRHVSGLSANYINTALGYVPERAEKPLNTLSTSGTISPATNTHNYIAPTGAVTLSLPASPTATIVNEIELQVNQSSAVTFTFGSNVLWGGEGAPDMGVGLWDIIFTWIKGANKWLGSYKKWTTS